MNIRQFLRGHALPGEKIKVVGNSRNKDIRGKTGILVRYSNAYVLIDDDEHFVTTNVIALAEDEN